MHSASRPEPMRAFCRSVDAIPVGIPGMPDAIASEVGIKPSDSQEDAVMSAGGNSWNSPRRVSTGVMQRQALVGALVLGALYWTQAWEGARPDSEPRSSVRDSVACVRLLQCCMGHCSSCLPVF